MEPDYDTYTKEELLCALHNIDARHYPARASRIEARLATLNEAESQHLNSHIEQVNQRLLEDPQSGVLVAETDCSSVRLAALFYAEVLLLGGFLFGYWETKDPFLLFTTGTLLVICALLLERLLGKTQIKRNADRLYTEHTGFVLSRSTESVAISEIKDVLSVVHAHNVKGIKIYQYVVQILLNGEKSVTLLQTRSESESHRLVRIIGEALK